ncbi:FG-GAP-like repeat-containing protein [Hymenobacter guriensis]|uniref:VCBS repeat-containing protein n=1 Tax=Hymenobacter guriensis TaxID=2793065 RepID=A0ABS0L373_9BACT|nr:FG-GAP-like repeat-containing protein [Hymenobacter guriensis]MBG8553832.1 VCBS repeat-containing protein [Hymenobacter guriensis]
MTLLLRAGWFTACSLLLGHLSAAQPTLSSVSPAQHAPAAPVRGPLTATFSQALQAGSGQGLVLYGSQSPSHQAGKGGMEQLQSTRLLFTPDSAWHPGETVRGTLTTGIKNTSGQALARGYVFEFQTATKPTGAGHFLPRKAIPEPVSATNPLTSALGDLDADGDLDLVVGGTGQAQADIRLNQDHHSGRFAAPTSNAVVSLSGEARQLELADVDGDGDLDLLALTNFLFTTGKEGLDVRLNNGKGQFSTPTAGFLEFSKTPIQFALGDLDADGDLDVASISREGLVQFYLNQGVHTGRFASSDAYPELAYFATTESLALADTDNDGDLDLLLFTGTKTLTVLPNDPTQTHPFSTDRTYEQAESEQSGRIATGDVDNDGDVDAIITNANSSFVAVMLNQGNGRFSASSQVVAMPRISHAELADVDGDQGLDLVGISYFEQLLVVRLNTGQHSGVFSGYDDARHYAFPGPPVEMSLGDLDGDGDVDAVISSGGQSKVAVRFNEAAYTDPDPASLAGFSPGKGPVGSLVTLRGEYLQKVQQVFFNGVAAPAFNYLTDSTLTVLVPAGATTGRITLRTTTGQASSLTTFTVVPATQLRVTTLSPARFATDVLAKPTLKIGFSAPLRANSVSDTSVVLYSQERGWLGKGRTTVEGGMLQHVPSATLRPGESVLVGIRKGLRSTTDSVLRCPVHYQLTAATGGTGRSYFQPKTGLPAGVYALDMTSGDIDKDGDLDMLVTSRDQEKVFVYLNKNGQGMFEAGIAFETSKVPYQIQLVDIDRDGDLDAVTSCEGYGDEVVQIRLNGGDNSGSATGVFSDGYDFKPDHSKGKLVIIDFAEDGTPSMAYANENGISLLGGGGFAYKQLYVGSGVADLLSGDVDNDGDLDLIYAAGAGVGVLRNGGDATGLTRGFTVSNEPVLQLDMSVATLAMGDVDNDGDLDIVVGGNGNDNKQVQVLLNGGDATGSHSGFFSAGTPVEAPGTIAKLRLSDLDHDGDLDLAISNGFLTNALSVYLNGGDATGSHSGVFTARRFYPVTYSLGAFELGDVDNDGDVDMMALANGADSVFVQVNSDGAGLLRAAQDTVCQDKPLTLRLRYAVGDVLQYQVNTGSGYQVLASTATTLTLPHPESGAYRAVVRNPNGETVYSSPLQITVLPAPTAQLRLVGDSTTCANVPVRLEASSNGTTDTYQFLRNGQPIAGATTATYQPTLSGRYQVTVTNKLGCDRTSGSITLTINPVPARPVITLSRKAGALLLTSSAAVGNQWYRNGEPIAGATAAEYTIAAVTEAADYTVVLTVAGCASPLSAPIRVSPEALTQYIYQLYPNPSNTGSVTLALVASAEPVTLELFNSMGGQVNRWRLAAGTTTYTLPVAGLRTGLYVLRATTPQTSESHSLLIH